MNISFVLDQVEYGNIALPEFQRGYVWTRDQVRGLFHSLYRRYPVGSLLTWITQVDGAISRGEGALPAGTVVTLLLDGQQRITSLYGVIKGEPPAFFQGNQRAFTDLYFHLGDERFEFYGPVKMGNDPLWVSVTDLFRSGTTEIVKKLPAEAIEGDGVATFFGRLERLRGIREIPIHAEQITGNELTIEEVVDIFNRVNSGGTKLSSGDLAIARLCVDRPSARDELRRMLAEWEHAGYSFHLEWLLRCVNSVATGRAEFSAMQSLSADEFATALKKTEHAVNFLLNLVADRLGLDHNRVLAGRYSFTALVRLVSERGGAITDHAEQQKVLFWYVHCAMWGRYSGSTVTVLQRDLDALARGGIDGAIAELRQWRGSLEVRAEDFNTHSVGARFYPVLYLLTRVGGAKDLGNGMELRANLLGSKSSLHLHHIFPKRQLRDHGYSATQANALGNMAFLTSSSNLSISDKPPAQYLAEIAKGQHGALESQWITTDPSLWQLDHYPAFLDDRRQQLAAQANEFLESLVQGAIEFVGEVSSVAPAALAETPEDEVDESSEVADVVQLAARYGLASPEVPWEVADEESGELLAFAELAWPDGAQPGLTEPVALLLEPNADLEANLNALGYRFFTSKENLVHYIEELVAADIDGDGMIGPPDDPPPPVDGQ